MRTIEEIIISAERQLKKNDEEYAEMMGEVYRRRAAGEESQELYREARDMQNYGVTTSAPTYHPIKCVIVETRRGLRDHKRIDWFHIKEDCVTYKKIKRDDLIAKYS